MKIFYFILFFAFSFVTAFEVGAQTPQKAAQTTISENQAKLRYDGFYCEPNNDGRTCLRFYRDGLVIDVSLFLTVTDEQLLTKVSKWFNRESGKKRSNLSEGQFKISAAKIAFSTTSRFRYGPEQRFVKIEYNGSIENSGDALTLDSFRTDIKERRENRRFEFIKITP